MQRFGTFQGVFTPTVLTILGVIMYLRLGWVVGHAGLWGSIVIILISKSVTLSTGLSVSSMASNIRVGAGGAYSFIARSLGLEAGGSIGIPLFIAQVLSASLYIIGFTQAFSLMLPGYDPYVISVLTWILLASATLVSTDFALKLQYAILVTIFASLVSFFLGDGSNLTQLPLSTVNTAEMKPASFWQVFAVFFPAATGIMAGISLSGELKNPKRSIPIGTLTAIFVTMIIYVVLAYRLYHVATPEHLKSQEMIMVFLSKWPWLVVAGIMGATLSSALTTMVGAPRVLLALAEEETLPFSKILSKKTKSHEPRNAIVATAVFIFFTLKLDLNQLATLITMFFLVTYGIVNAVVFIEQSMGFIGFRPSFRIPKVVPLFGAISCLLIMLLIDAFFTLVALFVVAVLYLFLSKRMLKESQRDIRAGFFQFLAERATKLAASLPRQQVSWKPDLLVPIEDPEPFANRMEFVREVVSPSGSLYAYCVQPSYTDEKRQALEQLVEPFKQDRLLVSEAIIENEDFLAGTKTVIQTLMGTPFKPNALFLTMSRDAEKEETARKLFKIAIQNGLGVMIMRPGEAAGFGSKQMINLWLRDRSTNWHLAMLLALQLQLNWDSKLRLVTVAKDESEKEYMENFLKRLMELARVPVKSSYCVLVGEFSQALKSCPKADLNIFGIGGFELPLEYMRKAPKDVGSAVVFVKDSGLESALA